MNHDTGKSCKFTPQDMNEMQIILSETLGMERGTSKELTGCEHLERTDYIVAKHKQEAEKAQAVREQAEAKLKAMDKENRDGIKSGLANLFGKGKYATIEKENETLRAENEQIRQMFPEALKQEVAKRTEKLLAEKRKTEAERQALVKERDETIRLLNKQKAEERQRIDWAICKATGKQKEIIGELQWKSALLNALANLLYRAGGTIRRAVAATINFAASQYKSAFSPSEAADIKEAMRSYGGGDTEQQKTVGKWLIGYAESREQLDTSN